MSDSIRDALTSAFDAAESAEPEADAIDTSAVDETSTETVSDAPDTAGAESSSDTSPATTAPAAAPAPSSPAPQSWSAEAKAAWASLPPTAQNEIRKRETELNRVLQSSAASRKTEAEFNEMFSPYDDLIKAHGATRTSVIQPMLAARYLLETGTVAQKAEFIVNTMRDYNIPVEVLDGALTHYLNANGGQFPVAQRPAPSQPAPDVSKLVQEALGKHPLIQAYQDRQTQAAEAAIDSVRSHPMFEEVKNTAADVLEQAHTSGRTLGLEAAFDIALRMHGHGGYESPAAQQQRDAAGRFAASKRAASSVSGAPVATGGYKPGTGTIRDELMNALQNAK